MPERPASTAPTAIVQGFWREVSVPVGAPHLAAGVIGGCSVWVWMKLEELGCSIKGLDANLDPKLKAVETSLDLKIINVQASLDLNIAGVQTSLGEVKASMDEMDTKLNGQIDTLQAKLDEIILMRKRDDSL
jgi:hypothetical protein